MSSERAIAAAEAAGIPYTLTRHGRVSSLAEAAATRGIEPADLIKTMVVRRGADDFVLVLVPGDREISWPKLRAALGVNRLSMPDAEVALQVTGYARGTITPFGATGGLPVVADASIGEPDDRLISLGSGEHGAGLTVPARPTLQHFSALLADITDPALP